MSDPWSRPTGQTPSSHSFPPPPQEDSPPVHPGQPLYPEQSVYPQQAVYPEQSGFAPGQSGFAPGQGYLPPHQFSSAPDYAAVQAPADPSTGWSFPAQHNAFQAPSAPAPLPSRPGRGWAATLVLAIGCLLLGLVGGMAGSQLGNRILNPPVDVPIATGGSVDRAPDSVAGVAARVLPSTVSIKVETASGQGVGSGFVLRSDGLILTNNHVVSGAQGGTVTVIFSDGSQLPGSILGRTVAYDLAVVKVNRSGLPELTMGDSDDVVVGDPVIAVGAPLGLSSTVTTGIVSALHRPVVAGESAQDLAFISAIQTDAAINPGNSGGPLVNANGEVIGVNSAIARVPGADNSASGSIGLGFAIPSTQAARTASQLITDGKATYPVIGVVLDRDYVGQGVRVATESSAGHPPVTPGGPAATAGIEAGDIIVAFQGRPVTEPDELIVGIRAQTPGSKVTLTVRHDGQQREVTVTLSETESN